MFRAFILASAIAFVPASASAAELIVNGGFENPKIASPCCNTVPTDSLPGWNVPTGNVNVVNGTFGSTGGNLAYAGSQYLDLVGEGSIGSLSQTFNTVADQVYTLTFAYSHNLFSGPGGAAALITINGLTFDKVMHRTGSTTDLDWLTYSRVFTATGPTTTLGFDNRAGGINGGIFLDAVSVTDVGADPTAAVPEPATWALILLGFAAIGGALRRKNREKRLSVSFA